jgi:hypothetical protein
VRTIGNFVPSPLGVSSIPTIHLDKAVLHAALEFGRLR